MKLNWKYKILIALVILIVLTPTAIYILQFGNRPLSSDPQTWGTFGDYIGGLINPVIGILTLIITIIIALELKKIEDQNTEKNISASYQPQIVVEEGPFQVYSNQSGEISKPVEFNREYKKPIYISDLHGVNRFPLEIYNIGLGAAKDVEFTFDFDVPSVINFIDMFGEGLVKDELIDVKYSMAKRGQRLDIKYPHAESSGLYVIPHEKHVIRATHILSTNVSQKAYDLPIPHIFLELYSIFLHTVGVKLKTGLSFDTGDYPPLTLKINYSDIGGRKFSNSFQIIFSFMWGGVPEYNIRLEIEENK
jgi:uncharacterized membrane protein